MMALGVLIREALGELNVGRSAAIFADELDRRGLEMSADSLRGEDMSDAVSDSEALREVEGLVEREWADAEAFGQQVKVEIDNAAADWTRTVTGDSPGRGTESSDFIESLRAQGVRPDVISNFEYAEAFMPDDLDQAIQQEIQSHEDSGGDELTIEVEQSESTDEAVME